ncbi:MAG: hypothetical protein M0Z72_01945 [Deltaproteobacteria bacterium]|nr:hypothetical protein [Deltaproteobacteria bacterium]
MTDETKAKLEEAIVNLIKEYTNKKRFKPGDVVKEMESKFSASGVTKDDVKAAIRDLTDSGRLIYGYAGGSFLALPE